MSAPKLVTLGALIGGDKWIVTARDRTGRTTPDRTRQSPVLTRMQNGSYRGSAHFRGIPVWHPS